jgi:hypothetical protein
MPREPAAGRFSQTNGVGRDRKSGTGDIDAVLQSAVIGEETPELIPKGAHILLRDVNRCGCEGALREHHAAL